MDLVGSARAQLEEYSLPEAPKHPAVAIGTTTAKALETWAISGRLQGQSSLYIRPPYQFKAVGALLTNFHGPRQRLLELTCAFGGTEQVMAAYREAADKQYMFGDYGDMCLLL